VRLGRGKLSLFDGDSGLGKSLVTLDLCARITTGQPFPDGVPAVAPSNVIIINGEG
jgi:RecA-family ATPase